MNPNNESEEPKFEMVELSALESMERAQIDVQISTAKKYPRVLSTVKKEMLSFATLDEETAAGCFFTLPGRKGGDGKPIQGPSIRMAEIALATYGNLRAGARIINDDGKMITAQGVCHDLQNNVCVSVEVKRRVTTKTGQRYGDDMIVMTGNAACSIALRNATFRVVPLALVKPIYEAAKKVAIGDAKTLVQRRAGAIAHFTKMGVTQDKIFAALQVKAIDDIGLEHLEVLIGYANAIKEGEATIDGVFNPAPASSVRSEPLNPFAAKTDAKKEGVTYSPADRERFAGELQDLILDGKATEKGLFSDSVKAGLIPEDQKALALFELPAATLAAIANAAKEGAK